MSKRSRDDYDRSDESQDPPLPSSSTDAAAEGSGGNPAAASGSEPVYSEELKGQARQVLANNGVSDPTPDDVERVAREIVASAADADRATAEKLTGKPDIVAPRAASPNVSDVRKVRVPASFPELEPPPGPTELHVAPAEPGALERDDWGERPSYDELEAAYKIEVRTLDPKSAGVYVGGVPVSRLATETLVQSIKDRGQAYLHALALDPQIQVRVIE